MSRKRSKHNLSNTVLSTMHLGQIVPIGYQEVLPGDSLIQSTTALLRVAPLNTPVMHKVVAQIFHVYTPWRIVWPNFEKFITGGPDGQDTSAHPYMELSSGDAVVGTLTDHFGIPRVAGTRINALPIRAYQRIYNWLFRDEDLITPRVVATNDGDDTTTDRNIQYGSWLKDRFTTARLEPLKGPEVVIPLGGQADVVFPTDPSQVRYASDSSLGDIFAPNGASGPGSPLYGSPNTTNPVPDGVSIPMPTDAYADLSTSTLVQIRQLRALAAIQRYRENRSLFGSRYPEYTRDSFGVIPADARLQEPELVGHGKQTIQFSEVLQTAPDTVAGDSGADGVGNLRGHGMGSVRSNSFRRRFTEHGCVITLMLVRPIAIYESGLDRSWMRQVKEDYYQPELENIGQAEIYKGELFASGAPSTDFETWGYGPRYGEYHSNPNQVHGQFRTTMDTWHFGRKFASLPPLDQDFINCVPTTQPFQVTDSNESKLWVMIKNRRKMMRVVGRALRPRLL